MMNTKIQMLALAAFLPLVVVSCENSRAGALQSPVYVRSAVISQADVIQRAAQFNRNYDLMRQNAVPLTQQMMLEEGGRVMMLIQQLGMEPQKEPSLRTFCLKLAELCEGYTPVR